MQIIENWADITGEVTESEPSGDFVTVGVKVNDVKDVSGHKNLLADRQDEVIKVNVPKAVWENLDIKEGATAVMRVRMASSRKLFVHPEHVRVT